MSALLHEIATVSARRLNETRLLVIDREADLVSHSRVGLLSQYLRRGDRLVVNDAATLPASFHGLHARTGAEIELRLLSPLGFGRSVAAKGVGTVPDNGPETFHRHGGGEFAGAAMRVGFSRRDGVARRWRAIIFGAGDWRTPTEHRALPPGLRPGDTLKFGGGLVAKILHVHGEISVRLVDIELATASVPAAEPLAGLTVKPNVTSLLGAIYRAGRPIQYSYLKKNLGLWDQQTLFSGPPVALEPPSASFALTWDELFRLRERGIEVLTVTHGTGVSDTGDARANALLPMPELTRVGLETRRRLLVAKNEGARIIAVGTGTVRALESWATGALEPRTSGAQDSATEAHDYALTTLRIGPETKLRIVTGILTGMHDTGASHLELLAAWKAGAALERGYREAEERGYLWHEYGDQCLLL